MLKQTCSPQKHSSAHGRSLWPTSQDCIGQLNSRDTDISAFGENAMHVSFEVPCCWDALY
jgi:hypothetical protein